LTIAQAAVLGLIQGLTEFLPVSSSGHLVLLQQILGITEPVLSFDIALHVGTLLAVCTCFFNDLLAIIKGLTGSAAARLQNRLITAEEKKSLYITGMIILGSIPTAIIGLLFNRIAHALYTSVWVVGCMLVFTGTFLWATRYAGFRPPKKQGLTGPRAFGVGIVQGLAVLPGVSRSGATIAMALFLGVDRATAVRFSFLLSIPAILGAALLALLDINPTDTMDPGVVGVGVVIAAVTGYLTLKWLVYMVRKGRLHHFAPYCWGMGLLALGWHFVKIPYG